MILFVNSKIKKAILAWCDINLKPNYIVAEISTFTKRRMPSGGYTVYVKIVGIGKIDPKFYCGYTNGDIYLDSELRVVGNSINQANTVFFNSELMNEAEDILKEN